MLTRPPFLAAVLLAHAAVAAPLAPEVDAVTGARTFHLWNGNTATVGADGVAVESARGGRGSQKRLRSVFTPPGASDLSLSRMLSLPQRGLATQRVTPGRRADFFVGSMALEPKLLDARTAVTFGPSRSAPVAG